MANTVIEIHDACEAMQFADIEFLDILGYSRHKSMGID